MRIQSALLLASVLLFASTAFAQTRPQPVRDYVYGPGGKLIVTLEPDTYPPDVPSEIDAYNAGCAIDGVDVNWNPATDIGSGVAYYVMNGRTFTGTYYHDSNVTAQQTYWYTVYAVDNAGNAGDSVSTSVYIPLCINWLVRKQFYWARFLPQLPRFNAPRPFKASREPAELTLRESVLRRITLDLVRSSAQAHTETRLSRPERSSHRYTGDLFPPPRLRASASPGGGL